MNEPISAGDLVVVVRFCECRPNRGCGQIFTVERIEPAYDYRCYCGVEWKDGQPLAYGRGRKGPGFIPLSYLKRIPPLGELNDVKREEELTE